MTSPCALKFVPRATALVAATFSLSLLSACSTFRLPSAPSDASLAPEGEGSSVAERVVAAARTPSPDAATPEVSAADPAYVIGPEDALEISVWRDDTLKTASLVRPDGGISFPLAGDFIVAGKTAAQVRDELVTRLAKYIPEPVVTVSVVRVASYRIYVLGRVNKPGDFQVGRNIDVLQALSLAGGMTPFAAEDAIQIIRKVEGKSISIPFDYARLRKRGGDLSQNITLKSGDVLLVP